MMRIKSKVLSIFASCGVYMATTAKITAMLTPAAAHKYMVSRASFQSPALWLMLALRQKNWQKTRGIVLDSHSQMATALTETAN